MRLQKSVLVGVVATALSIPAAAQTNKFFAPATVSYLGVGLQEINSDRAMELKLPEEAGVEITSVDPNSPASTAGLKTGDVILQYNGQRVEGLEQFSRMVRETPAGREVKLQVFRGGSRQTLTAKIAQTSQRFGLVFPTNPPQPAAPFQPFSLRTPPQLRAPGEPMLGIQGENLEGQLADYFGVKEGVLVRSVTKGSAAEKAGIKAGDVITRLDDNRIAAPADITNHIRSRRGQSVSVVLTRDHKEMTLKVALDDDKSERF